MNAEGLIEALVERDLFGLLGIHKLLSFCEALPPVPPEKFGSAFLAAMGVTTAWSGLAREEIPADGPLIVVANHPFGLIEALALEAMLLERRADVNFIAWHFLRELPGLGQHYIFVDPLRSPKTRKQNVTAWRQAFKWIERGGALGVFPAGRVARFQWSRMAVADWPWNPHVARIARRLRTRVLPVFFHGRNSLGFVLAGIAMPTLHQSLIVHQVNNKRGFPLRATIGTIIQPAEFTGFETDEEAIAFLRSRTEALAAT